MSGPVTRCQLQVLYEGTSSPDAFSRIRNLVLRLRSALSRRIVRVTRRLFPARDAALPPEDPGPFSEGDWVEILPLEQLRKTLDGKGRHRGLEFFEVMERYCGGRYRVLKVVRTIFDERQWRMLRIRDTVLLEGVVCDGRRMYEKEGCDRCCFLFWKTAWLRRCPPP